MVFAPFHSYFTLIYGELSIMDVVDLVTGICGFEDLCDLLSLFSLMDWSCSIVWSCTGRQSFLV